MFIIADLKTDEGEKLESIPVLPKEFKTGSRGFYANMKTEIGGKRYQIQIQMVEIGSKNRAAESPASE